MSFADVEWSSRRRSGGGRNGSSNSSESDEEGTRALLFQLATALTSYRRLVNSLAAPKAKATPLPRHQLQNSSLHILRLAKDANDKLKRSTAATSTTAITPNKRIADTKLAKDFAAIMEEFRKLQDLAMQREMASMPIIPLPPSAVQSSYTIGDAGAASADRIPEHRQLLLESKRQEVLQLDNEIVFNEAIIEERDHAIQEIQKQIGEVNEIFKDLAVMVHEQGVMIEEIDSNIENSVAATAEGKTEISKASKSRKSNSSLVCLLLVIFGIVLLVVIIVVAA